MYNTLYHTCMYNQLLEDEPLGSKHVEDIVNWNISVEKVHLVGLYFIIIIRECYVCLVFLE